MSRRQKHIELSEPEYDRLLNESKYHDKPEYREKCRALMLNHAGVTIKQVAIHLQVHFVTIGNWIMDWEKDKFDSLARKKGQGCKAILVATDPVHIDCLDQAVSLHRQDIKGIKAELIKSLGKPMSNDTVKRFLKKIIIHGGASDAAPTQRKTK
jgi:transposase